MPQGCIADGTCHTVVSYELSNAKYLFKIIGYPVGGPGGYIALGLSPGDNQMGGDLTTACFYDLASNKVVAQTGFNVGKSNVQLEDPLQDLQSFQGKFEDGVLQCSFERPEHITVKEHGAKINLFNDAFAVLVAKGRVYSNQRLARHDIREASSQPQKLGLTGILKAKSKLLLRLHGAFMIGAWVFSASLGILLARYDV